MKKKLIIFSLCILFLVGIGSFLYFYFTNPNRLTSLEKRFLAENSSTVQNIGVINDVYVFGDNGQGVFYDFIRDFSKEYSLKTNNVIYNLRESTNGVSFTAGNEISENEFVFFTGHYVLLSKKPEFVSHISHINKSKVGILEENENHIASYIDTSSLMFTKYKTKSELVEAFKEEKTDLDYVLVPLYLYLDEILEHDLAVVTHLSSIPYYYKVNFASNPTLGSIIKKYYATWKKEDFQESFYSYLFQLYTKALNLSSTDIEAMRSITYQYGFVSNPPYEILSGGNYGGIIAQYLKEFSEFSGIDFKFIKYKNKNKYLQEIQNNKINLTFSFYEIPQTLNSVSSGISLSYSIIVPKKNSIVLDSLKALNGKTVYVLEDSCLATYLKENTTAQLLTYKSEKELQSLLKKGEIIVIDSHVFQAKGDLFKKYNVRYSDFIDLAYPFKISANDTFTKLFTKFISLLDSNSTTYKGFYNYDLTLRTGSITGAIAKYFMYILFLFVCIFLYVYRLTKKVKLSKKIKKEDKLKYIDQLTSLKNRNYLNENLESWSQNTIYPQTIVVIDLNSLQIINDTMGYEKGDEQIKSAANILVKMQLDNSDIIRTDGNEFVIYLIGYQAKQISSYIHKLSKEFKKLPYEYGAAIGYSMILDNLKTIEDAMNEAVEEVKKQKEKVHDKTV